MMIFVQINNNNNNNRAIIALPAESPRADRNAILLSTTSYGGPLKSGSPEHKETAWPLQSRREAARRGHAFPLVAEQILGMGCHHCAHLRRLIFIRSHAKKAQ